MLKSAPRQRWRRALRAFDVAVRLSVCLSLRLSVPGSIHPSSERRICRSCPSDLPAWLPGSTDADVKRERRRRRRHRYKLLN